MATTAATTSIPAPPRERTASAASPWPRRAFWGIAVLLLVRVATLSVLPLVDSTESRYAQVAAEMAELGDYSTPMIRIHDQLIPFEGKPPLHFWVGAWMVEIFGRGEVAARLPSLLAIALTALFLARGGRAIVGEEAARAATLLFCASPFVFLLSGTVLLDGTLTAWTTGAVLIGLAHSPRHERSIRLRSSAALGLTLALGFLTKGPIALAVVGTAGLMVCAVRRSLDPFRGYSWLLGGAVFFVVAGPWFILRELQSPGFLEYFFWQENVLRFVKSDIGDRYGNVHEFFRGASLAWWAVAAIPLLFLIVRTSLRGELRSRVWDRKAVELIAASLGLAILLSPSRHILVTYLLPIAPIAALAAGHLFVRAGFRLERLGTICIVLAGLYGIGMFAAEPKLSEDKSTRDAMRIATALAVEHESPEVVFPRKTPWSAYYYGGEWVVPRPMDRYLMRIHETIAEHPDAIFVFKRRELRRLPEPLRARFTFLDERGQWHFARHTGEPPKLSP